MQSFNVPLFRVTVLAVLLLAALSPLPARAQGTRQPAPPIYSTVSVQRWNGHAWEASQVLALGDRVRFTVRFYTPQPGWRFPHGMLVVQQERTPQYAQKVIAGVALHRLRSYSMDRILTAEVRVGGRAWLGTLLAQFNLRNGGGASIGISVSVLVQRPPAPGMESVHGVLAACASRRLPPSRHVWVRAYFKWRSGSAEPYTGRLTDVPAGRKVRSGDTLTLLLPAHVLRPNLGPPPNGPLYAHGLVRCGFHTLIADRYPLFP